MDNKIILVTGATGFIGSHFCQKAQQQGCRVIAFTRSLDKAHKRLPGVTAIQNLAELSSMGKIDYVVNLAGEPLVSGRWNVERKQDFLESRVGLTNRLFDYFQAVPEPPKILISGSAVGYYGPQGDKLLDEAAKHHNSYSHHLCSEWEHSALQFTQLGTRVCCLRTGIVLGAEEGALGRMLPPFKFGLGGRLGTGKQWMPWVHIEDVIDLIFHCFNRSDIKGGINASSPNPVTNRQFSKTLGSVLSRPAILPMPSPLARLLFGEMADELLLTGQRVVPRKALESGFEFSYPELRPALEQILLEKP
ncbi:MAG: TIGR01777 family oxidoreductase [Porticoccus sp.]|nr:TIGR01777 family oxidoreductase [Porticoccus sp.]